MPRAVKKPPVGAFMLYAWWMENIQPAHMIGGINVQQESTFAQAMVFSCCFYSFLQRLRYSFDSYVTNVEESYFMMLYGD